MIKKYFFNFCIIAFCIISIPSFGQRKNNATKTPKPPKPIINKKPIVRKSEKEIPLLYEFNMGVDIASNGLGLQAQRLKRNDNIDNAIRCAGFYAEFGQTHHIKESKIVSKLPNPAGDKGPKNLKYTFGKVNAFFPLKIGYLIRQSITGKLEKNHILISVLGGGGLSLGLLKPYYLELARGGSSSVISVDEKYSEANADLFLNPRYIFGYSGFSKGWGEVQFIGGITTKAAVQFEYSTQRKSALVCEIGGEVDAYINKVPILVGDNNQSIFPNIYIAIKKAIKW